MTGARLKICLYDLLLGCMANLGARYAPASPPPTAATAAV